MDPQRSKRISSLVHSCEELSPSERDYLLDRACLGDDELRRAVEQQLESESADTRSFQTAENPERALPDHYKLVKLIGKGGMAAVYLAQDTRLDRRVAIKFLHEPFRRDVDRMRRFAQEARTASALNHPNIITIYDIGENDGVQFIVTEYIEGDTLGSKIRRGPIPVPQAVDISIQIASALGEAHQAGIIHRDLKPDNVMVRRDGSVKVLDFGLAKENITAVQREIDHEGQTMEAIYTTPGLIHGTPQYMSPEQSRALPLDGRTDIFSLGCVIFEMLTAKRAFTGSSSADVIASIIGKEPRRLEDHLADPPSELVRILDKTLRKDRDQRYSRMDYLLSDLRDLSQDLSHNVTLGKATRRSDPIETTSEAVPSNKHSRWVAVLLITAVVMAVFVGTWFYRGREIAREISPALMHSVPIASWSSSSGESVFAAAFAPDSKMVAYASTKSGSTEIWVKPTVGGDAIQVTKNGFYNQYPIWSPNGQELAFFSNRANSNGIWRIAFTGGQEVQIVSGIDPSSQVLGWANGSIYFRDKLDVFSIDETTGNRKQVTDFGAAGVNPRNVALSRDGASVAAAVQDDGQWKIRIFHKNTSVEVAASIGKIQKISFHANGNTIFYSASVGGILQVFKVDGPGSAPVQISNGTADLAVQDVSADGTRILVGSVEETSDLWSVDSQTLEELPVANDVALEYWADVSSDGKRVAYQTVLQPDKAFSGSISAKTLSVDDKPTLISRDGISPVWSHDGRLIAYFKRADDTFGIWTAQPTGADATKVADDLGGLFRYLGTPYLRENVGQMSWSPDDRTIAYANIANGPSNIWAAASDGSETHPITSNTDPHEEYRSPIWASDGRAVIFTSETRAEPADKRTYRLWHLDRGNTEQKMIFESKDPFVFVGLVGDDLALIAQDRDPGGLAPTPASTALYLLSLATNTKKEIAALDRAYLSNIHLSRDGKTIAFVTRRNDITEIWTISATGGTPKRILSENDPKNLISSLAWSPDNKTIIFGKQTRTNLLSMLSK